EWGHETPDVEDPQRLLDLTALLAELRAENLILAYHDRSDGGLFATLAEMAFSGHCGLEVDIGDAGSALASLFSEELGVVLQVRDRDESRFTEILQGHGQLAGASRRLGSPIPDLRVRILAKGQEILNEEWTDLRRAWSETSWRMRRLRD